MADTTPLHDQQFLHGNGVKGDCFRACLATVLGKPLHAVPHFALLDLAPDVLVSMESAIAWINYKGFETDTDNEKPGYLPLCIINGTSPRGIGHAVVGDAKTGAMVHDPHPSREGLSHISSRFYFYPIESEVRASVPQTPLTDERIDELLEELDSSAREYDDRDYGLPQHDVEFHARAHAAVRAIESEVRASVVPQGWREFIEKCARAEGGMVSGNLLSITAKQLLAAAPQCPQPQAEPSPEVERDAKRLDLLDGTLFMRKWNGVVGSGCQWDWSIAPDFRHTMQRFRGETLRAAIDAALSAEGSGGAQ